MLLAVKILTIFAAGFILMALEWPRTISVNALEFILKSDILTADERSGDSISHIYIDSPHTGSGSDGGTEPVQELASIHGEHSLTTLPFYFFDNTNSPCVGFLEQQFWMRKFKVFRIKNVALSALV